jgi:hypothetical protein
VLNRGRENKTSDKTVKKILEKHPRQVLSLINKLPENLFKFKVETQFLKFICCTIKLQKTNYNSGVFSEKLDFKASLALGTFAIVFLAEVCHFGLFQLLFEEVFDW